MGPHGTCEGVQLEETVPAPFEVSIDTALREVGLIGLPVEGQNLPNDIGNGIDW